MLVGVTGWRAQVWACWGEGRNQLLTFFPFLSLSENISWGLAESCCTCHTHFSSLCAFSVSVTYCWETEFNHWPPALLINCLLLSIGSGDTGTGPQTGTDIFCSMSCLYWQEQFLAIRLLQQAVNLGQHWLSPFNFTAQLELHVQTPVFDHRFLSSPVFSWWMSTKQRQLLLII